MKKRMNSKVIGWVKKVIPFYLFTFNRVRPGYEEPVPPHQPRRDLTDHCA